MMSFISGMILRHRIGDVMEQRRLAGARRGDDQTALAHAERGHHVHDARGVTLGHGFQNLIRLFGLIVVSSSNGTKS